MITDQTFENVTQERWNSIKYKVTEETGVHVFSDFGVDESKGWRVAWKYWPDSLKLNIQVVAAPDVAKFFPGRIKSKIQELVGV